MPTYEYECKSCGHTFEAFQSISEDPLKDCPECGKEVRRLINGGSGVIFKGSGFYVTDKKAAPSGGKTKDVKKAAGGDTAGGEKPAGSEVCASCPVAVASGGSCAGTAAPAGTAAASGGETRAAG
jgi:putative FmdB family regulatory protein